MACHHSCVEEVRGQLLARGSGSVLWEFTGLLTRQELETALFRVEALCMAANEALPVRKRVVSVLVEGLENILHHSGREQVAFGSVLVACTGDSYRIVLVNQLDPASAALLQHRIHVLNTMHAVLLKEHYLELLTNGRRSAKGGAGLGLLIMARLSSRPMRVSVTCTGTDKALLCLDLAVARVA